MANAADVSAALCEGGGSQEARAEEHSNGCGESGLQ